MDEHKELIGEYRSILKAHANDTAKRWWERYVKGVIPFIGVGIPVNRKILGAWRKENGIDRWEYGRQLELALSFFDEPVAEEKLAGILFLQEYLYDKLPFERLFCRYEEIFDKRLIFDWNICDWFSVRVLSPTIGRHGPCAAQAVASWSAKGYLWQARSSVVPFVNLATVKEYYPQVREAAAMLIRREERFAKTAVGWVLRDLSKQDKGFVLSFIDRHLRFFTKECLDNSLKYFDRDVRAGYRSMLKESL